MTFLGANGNVGIGTTEPTSKLHVADTTVTANRGIKNSQYSADAVGPAFTGLKSRGATVGTDTVVTADNALLSLAAYGYDTNSYALGGAIVFYVDGTPGDGDMPGRIQFKTVPDGSESLSDRMVIKNDGTVGIGTTAPARTLHVAGTARITTSVATTETRSLCTDATGDIELVASNSCVSSSRRNKENITGLKYGLDEINKLNPVFYNFKTFDQGGFEGRTKRRIGFIAEDMISVIPEVVLVDGSGLPETIDYSDLVSLLAKGIQEQQKQIDDLKKTVEGLKVTVEELKKK